MDHQSRRQHWPYGSCCLGYWDPGGWRIRPDPHSLQQQQNYAIRTNISVTTSNEYTTVTNINTADSRYYNTMWLIK